MELNIKVVNAGKCMMCGKPIKLVVHRGYRKLPNILFCEECDQKRQEQENKEEK